MHFSVVFYLYAELGSRLCVRDMRFYTVNNRIIPVLLPLQVTASGAVSFMPHS